jgi:hypothetical protein
MLDKTAERATQHLAWSLAFRSAPQDAPHSLGRVGERRLEPALEGPIGKALTFVFCHDFEQRIDPRFHWPLPQEVAAESVNGAHAGKLEF